MRTTARGRRAAGVGPAGAPVSAAVVSAALVSAALLTVAGCAGGSGTTGTSTGASGSAGSSDGGSAGPAGGLGAMASALASVTAGASGAPSGSAPGAVSAGASSPSASPSASASASAGAMRTVAAGDLLMFSTPSKNIGCAMSADEARCDIAEKTWTVAKPGDCEFDYGNGLFVASGAAGVMCAGDTVLGGSTVVGYDQGVVAGDLQCLVSKAGVACRNTATGHGFTLSREAHAEY